MTALDVDVEEELAQRLARGEECAFDEVVRRYAPDLQRLAARLLGTADAADVVQEVLIRVYLKRHAFRGQSSLRTWLMRITINQCRSCQRRRLLRLDTLWRHLRPHHADPPAALARDELQVRVRSAVATLPLRDREVVILHYLEELPVDQVAPLVGATPGAVLVRLHRARRRLAELLAHTEGPDYG